jgi:hypothetical protein
MTISLAFLAPDLVKAAIDGRLPQGMGVAGLTDLVEAARNAPSSVLTRDSNRVSAKFTLRCRETRFCGAETKAPKRPLKSNRQLAETKMRARVPASSGLFATNREFSVCARLALVGCSEAEIATVTGHSLRDVRSILDAHYLHRDQAESAIRKLEMGYAQRSKMDSKTVCCSSINTMRV